MQRLPKGVVEVLPDKLFLGPASAVKEMLCAGVRHIVCCTETCDSALYQRLVDELQAVNTVAMASPKKATARRDKGALEGPPTAEGSNRDINTDEQDADEERAAAPQNDDDDGDGCGLHGAAWLGERLAKAHVAACPMLDTLDFVIDSVVPQAVDFIDAAVRNVEAAAEEEQHAEGCPQRRSGTDEEEIVPPLVNACYVHCSAGVSRSPTVVIAFLIARRGQSVGDALDLLGPSCRPNPNFMEQLMALEEQCTGNPSQFNLQEYNTLGLCSLFPALSADEVRAAMTAANGNVVVARAGLMKKSLQTINRHEAMVAALIAMVDHTYVSEAEVRQVYADCGQQRDQALLQLLERQNHREEQARRSGGASKSAD
jgi:hypothetical protein